MNLFDCIQTFIALADHGSVQKTAQLLHQTPAAISRKITKLESHLNAQLIKRERSGAVLTSLGQQYYHQCKQGVALIDQANTLTRQYQQKPSGKLHIVANSYYTQHFLLPKLGAFMQQYPDICCYFSVQEVLPQFKGKDIDILFGCSFNGDDNLRRKRVDQWRHVICASPSYLKQHSTPQSPAELLQHDFIVHSSRAQPNVIYLNETDPLEVKPAYYFDQSAIIIEAALQHLGLIWVPEPFVADLIAKGRLCEVLQKYNENTVPAYVYYRHDKQIDPKVRAFIEHFASIDQ